MGMTVRQRRALTRERDALALACEYLNNRGYDLLAEKVEVVVADLTEDLKEDQC
ncbi:hypothetical protein PQD13_gp32 [Gordonia phage Clawz]|uniref:Uncharacterized protein n=1 Tax=Gordonia phage Clawz TaxID=2743910 RepID=A0AAE7K688_9CAUD|nr:hypothetical protein PQD13_gp32 [Gordonia phage Clawz]QKY79944.1 hypothetical protein SEA_CLAWZ_32 [Gordonia phage Clawz]